MSRTTILHKSLISFIMLLLLAAPTWAQAADAVALAPGERLPIGDALSAPAQRHPLMIEVMRNRRYPGSEITIEQTLAAGSNYNRYIASYRSEGLKIYALLTIPRGARPASGWPVIVFNHGYIPPEQYRTTERYVAYVDYFARAGYIVFRPDYRGHGSSEGVATGGYGTPDYTVDVLNAVSSLKRYPGVDRERIGMWGHSMGGHITLRAMVTTDDIRAGVIWGGVVASYEDMMYNWRRPVPVTVPQRARRWRQDLIERFGTPQQNAAFWNSISPISYVADASGPIQLHHGTQDESVPLEFSASLYAALQEAGVPSAFYQYAGDNHNISANFRVAMQRSLAFFDQYVKNYVPLPPDALRVPRE